MENTFKKINSASIMDIKSFEYFNEKTYIALALNSYVQIYEFSAESDGKDMLKPCFKIETQIGIYKININKIDRTKQGWPPI